MSFVIPIDFAEIRIYIRKIGGCQVEITRFERENLSAKKKAVLSIDHESKISLNFHFSSSYELVAVSVVATSALGSWLHSAH